MFHLSIRVLLAAASITTSAWAADPADPAAPTRPLDHRSVFDTYRATEAGTVGNWREANDAVGRQAGCHAHDHGSTAAAPPDPHAGHDLGARAATGPHSGHHGQMHGHMHGHMHDQKHDVHSSGHRQGGASDRDGGHHGHDHGSAAAQPPHPHAGHDHGASPAGEAAKRDHGAAGGEAKPHHCPHHAAHHASMHGQTHGRMHDAHPSGHQHGSDSGAMKPGHGHHCHHDIKEGGDAHKH